MIVEFVGGPLDGECRQFLEELPELHLPVSLAGLHRHITYRRRFALPRPDVPVYYDLVRTDP